MDIRSGIIQAANALGIDPLDLATAISYETAGTFNPTTTGPTTKWGQHRGFIQFGEPQAKQHGVDWNDPVRSQLGEEGAVVSYLKSSGVKPGMGLLDIYSAINAGAPGLYNRSDAAAGGAPGTVRDKVMNQMSGHRKKAAELLGMTTPMVSSQSNPAASVAADTMTALGKGGPAVTPDQIAQGAMAQSAGMQEQKPRGLLGGFFSNPDTMANLAIALNSMRLNPDPAIAQLLASQMKERRSERKETAQLNKTLAYLEKAAAAGDSRAARALEYAKGTGDIANALKIATEKAPKASEAEQKINRLMADYDVDRKTAVGIVDGVVVVNRDPVTGQAQLVNKVTGDIVGSPSGGTGQITEAPLPPVEASDTFADTNVSGALGARGFGASVLNTVTDAVGLGQWADETGKAQQALQNLSARTMLGLSAEFPGRPSNLTRERIEEMTVMPGEITTGPDKALNKTREMRKLLEQAYAAASIAASGQGRYSPTQVAEASQSIGQIESLLADYIALEDALTKGLGGSQPSAQTGGGRASGTVSINGKNIPWKIKE